MRARGLVLLAVTLWAGALGRDGFERWIAATDLPPLSVATSTEVLDRHGNLLRAYTVADGRWRLAADPGQVDPLFTRMLVAYEDKRFWTHGGVDPLAMLRAAGQAVTNGGIVSGASTLTMQTARLLEDGPTGQLAGKLRQIRVALALERRLTKEQILALYYDRAPYGGNTEGLRAAARAWFGKEPARLTPAEAALLVALPQSPETRRPDRHPDAGLAARNRVLDRMAAAGVISPDTAVAALHEPVPTARREMPALAAHLADRALRDAPGLGVHMTTLDGDLQMRLEALAARAVRDHGGGALSIAIIVADHTSGEVLASVGSAGYSTETRQGFVDMTTALRSPGSTLKPLVYAMAFDDGLAQPETMIDDHPIRFAGYAPRNFDGLYRGPVTITEALQLSLNIPVVMLTSEIGPARLFARMKRAGTAPVLPGNAAPGLAISLGGVGITPEDLTRLYAGLANGGVAVPLRYRPGLDETTLQRIVSPEAAWQVGHILAGMPPPPNAPRERLAYKTGTSYGHRDTWAVGFDGRHVVTIWMGRPDGTPVPGAFGADMAAPILFEAFSRVKPALDPLPPPPPATLILSTAALPAPLRAFRPRGAVFGPAAGNPSLAFPPDGALIETAGGKLVVKIRDGKPPFTLLANGAPVVVGSHLRESHIALMPGHVSLAVIDAEGRAARAQVEIR